MSCSSGTDAEGCGAYPVASATGELSDFMLLETQMKIRGFISYTHADERHADRLAEKLRLFGVEVWRDRHQLSAGCDLTHTVGNAIEKDTDVVFVVVSARALFAPWVKWENERAGNAAAAGHHLKVVYIVVEDFVLPEEVRKHVYIDFIMPSRERADSRLRRELRATEDLARYLLSIRPLTRLGIYDVFYSYADLDQRRESSDGVEGANIYQFVRSARQRVSGVGFFFGHLFGMEGGTAVASWVHSHATDPDAKIDLYVPDPDSAPLENLREIYPHGEQIPGRIVNFIKSFTAWGRQMRLSEQESRMVTLTLLKCCPTASILAIDPDEAKGRIIVTFSPTGYGSYASDSLLHVELRYPQTPIYQRFCETLHFVQSPAAQAKAIATGHV